MINNDFYIIGIGASAGGYEALKDFFSQIPENPGASFVVIQHLDRNFKSLTADWLSKYTDMSIVTVREDTEVRPDHIYIMPEDKLLQMKGRNLVVSAREEHQAINLAIDIFFQSLGEQVKEQSVGIILSGTGTDGSRGIVTIKQNGGIVLVQQPDSAEFDGMPRVDIAVDHPDLIQPPAQLAEELLQYIHNPLQFDEGNQDTRPDKAIVQDIVGRVSEYSKVNFKGYKINTIIRRIERRTKLNHLQSLSEYQAFMNSNPYEVQALYNDLLIGVTAFFRDPEAFEALQDKVIPELFRNKKSYETVRIWVAACSTGEEAYSIAMLCDAYVQDHNLDIPFKIFATDIDDRAIEVASAGRYTKSIETDVSQERLQTYFKKTDDFYVVKKHLRKRIIFARHNLTIDPPFLNLHLISCRNLFIYLKSNLQKKILHNFNFALKPNGFLFLGANEASDYEQELFEPFDAKWKMLRSKPQVKRRPHTFESAAPSYPSRYDTELSREEPRRASLRKESPDIRFEELLINEFAPACILLNREHEVVYSHGNAERFLQFPQKRMSLDVFQMVSGNLSTLFRNGIRKVTGGKESLMFRDVPIEKDGAQLSADIFFKVVQNPNEAQQFVLVHFMPASGKADKQVVEEAVNEATPYQEVRELELELEDTKQELLYTVEELETLNQELQATNEEMRSSNEELQSTNEEMQSSNEELHTVNSELQFKLDEISSLHNDISNLVTNTDLSIIFLDEELKIRMFTPAAKANFSFMESDIGRPLSHLSHNLQYHGFADDAREVMEKHLPIEKEVEDSEGHFYIMRLMPYKTERQRIKGVVITFIDITPLKLVANDLQKRTGELEESERNCKTLVSNTPDIIARYNEKLEYVYINEALEKHLGLPAAEILGKTNFEIAIPDSELEIDRWIASVEKAFATQKITDAYFVYGEGETEKHFYTSFVPEFCPTSQKVLSVLSISREVTELKQHEKLIEEQNKQLKKINNDLDNFVYTASHDLKTPILNIEGLKNILYENLGTSKNSVEMEVMDLMDASISKFKSTISDLTDISKIQKNIQFEEEDIAFEEVYKDVKADMNNIISWSDARIQTNFQVEHIRYARYYLRSIVYNLLSNAIKYRSDKPVEIQVRTYREGQAVVLSVTDNGLGIEESHYREMFKMFKRFHDHVDGSGIGLYIVNRIIENNGGKIEVDSEKGKGTTFRVYFM